MSAAAGPTSTSSAPLPNPTAAYSDGGSDVAELALGPLAPAKKNAEVSAILPSGPRRSASFDTVVAVSSKRIGDRETARA